MKLRYLLLLCLIALWCSAVPALASRLLYDFSLDSSPGWSMQGGWQYGAPPGTSCVPGAHSGDYIYGYQVGGSYCSGDVPSPESLTTTALDCTGAQDVHLRFWRSLGLTANDRAAVEVSTNGSTWTTIWETTDWTGDGGWTLCDYDLSALADNQPTVYVRWVLGPMVADTCYCIGWNVDDVQLWEGTPPPAFTSHPVYTWNLDSDPGWTTEGAWAYGTPTGGSGDTGYPDPTSGHTGSNVYGYNLSGGYVNSMPAYNLTTTAIGCTNIEGATLVFWRWLGVERANWDHALVQASNDGVNWTMLYQNPLPVGSSVNENYWQLCVYDMSAVADGQPSVYIRWVMGPTDSSVTYCGWNIDDIQIWEGPPVSILAWTAYADTGWEYPNTLQALTDELGSGYLVQPSTVAGQVAGDYVVLSQQLEGKQVFLAIEQESATPTQATTAGTEFGPTLASFAGNGGTLVIAGEEFGGENSDFITATGLMTATYQTVYYSGALSVVADWHPLAAGVGASVAAQNSTGVYTIGAETLSVIQDGSGNTALAVRDYGAGAVVLLGYDFYAYDLDAAQILANAVQYPRSARRLLLYSDSPFAHRGAEALRRLGYVFTQTNEDDFDQALTSEQWDLVVFDNPNLGPYGAGGYFYYDSLLDYLGVWGKSAADSWQLGGQPDLAAAYDVQATTALYALTPVYQWTSAPFFTTPNVVPDLMTWSDPGYGIDGFELTALNDGISHFGEAHGGYAATPTTGRAAVVADTWNTTVMSGFLWDEAGQDADENGVYDGDGTQDVVELVMNQIVHLTRNPYVDMSFSPAATTTGATVDFTGHLSATAVGATWWFGDGNAGSGTAVSHSYANPGFYTVSFVGDQGDYHYGIRTAPRQMIVGFPDAGPAHWACHQIIACFEDGIVTGYWDGYHPAENVTRAQMAVYVARALAGGDANVPPGPGTATFADVATDYWAFKYVEYAVDQAVVQGYWDGYHPDEVVNRAQMAVYMARAVSPFSERPSLPSYTPPGTATFPDVPTDYWAYKYVEFCYAQGIVTGYWDGYHPVENVNRGQMAVYVQRAFDLWMPYS